jgi:hypothetical protein|nr:MAG: alpha/beta hydrolase [Pseudomonadota bacterium]
MNRQSRTGLTCAIRGLVACAAATGVVTAVQAAAPAPAPTITELTTVQVSLRGNPPSGPHAVVVEHDPGLPTHTIYRPEKLGPGQHPVVVWGEGGCAKNGLMFPEFLTELASHGFVIIADGPPGNPGAGAGGPNGPAAAGAGPRPGGAGAPPGGAGGPPRGFTMRADGTDLINGLDWLEAESRRAGSRFQGKVNVQRVAAMGMSCGGLMSYGAGADPRVATVGIWNSGLVEPDQEVLGKLHGSVIIVTGGESDIAYANGKRDFETMPARIPVFHGVYPSVGHGGTYQEDNGGAYGVAAVAWLKWQLQGDTGPGGRGYFVGDGCGICKDAKWVIQSRSLP